MAYKVTLCDVCSGRVMEGLGGGGVVVAAAIR